MDVHVEDMINKIKKCNVEKKEVYCIHTYAHINVNLCIEMHFDWYRCCFSSFWWHSFVWFFYWHYSNFLHSALNWGHPPYATAFIFWKHILKLFPDAFYVSHSSHISDCKLELAIEIMTVATFPLAFLCSFLSSYTPNKQVSIVQPLQFYKYKSSHVVWL